MTGFAGAFFAAGFLGYSFLAAGFLTGAAGFLTALAGALAGAFPFAGAALLPFFGFTYSYSYYSS